MSDKKSDAVGSPLNGSTTRKNVIYFIEQGKLHICSQAIQSKVLDISKYNITRSNIKFILKNNNKKSFKYDQNIK